MPKLEDIYFGTETSMFLRSAVDLRDKLFDEYHFSVVERMDAVICELVLVNQFIGKNDLTAYRLEMVGYEELSAENRPENKLLEMLEMKEPV